MPIIFHDDIFAVLASKEITGYNFIDIYLDGEVPEAPDVFPNLHLTDYNQNITMDDAKGVSVTYEAELIEGVEPPSKTGNVTQEVQRISIAQPLGRETDPAEFINRLGNKFHAALIICRTFVEVNGVLDTSTYAPITAAEGIIKSASRKLQSNNVVVEFTNSYGKLDMVKSLRTSAGSVQRFDKEDTCFDRASLDVAQRVLEWGTK